MEITSSIEDLSVQRLGRSMPGDQGIKMIVPVVFGRQPEDRPAHSQAEPDHGVGLLSGSPIHLPQEPGGGHPGELGPGRPVEVHRGVGMRLEVGGGHVRVDSPFHGSSDDLSLVLPRREKGDLPGVHDGGHTQGKGLQGNVLLAEKIGGGVGPGDGVQEDEMSPGLTGRPGLIEADVSAPPDAQEHEVDAARDSDGLVVFPAVTLQLLPGSGAVGNVDVLRGNLQSLEEVLPHEPDVAVVAPQIHGIVLVQVEGDDPGKIQSILSMKANELPIHPDGSGARGQT